MSFENALAQWQDGLRRLADAPPEEQRMLEREARRLGMVKAGEKSYVIQDLPKQR